MADHQGIGARSKALGAATATILCVALVLVGHSPAHGAAHRTIVVGQTDNDGYGPFGFRTDDRRFQKIGQTFHAPSDGVKLRSLSLNLWGTGTAIVRIYKVRHHAPVGKLLMEIHHRVRRARTSPEGWRRLKLHPALPVETGQRYGFTLTTAGKYLLYSEGGGGYKDGKGYVLSPRWTGSTYDHDHYTWYCCGLIDDWGFKLRFR